MQPNNGANSPRWRHGVDDHRDAGQLARTWTRASLPFTTGPLRAGIRAGDMASVHNNDLGSGFLAQGEFETRDAEQELNNLEIGNLICKGAQTGQCLRARSCVVLSELSRGTQCARMERESTKVCVHDIFPKTEGQNVQGRATLCSSSLVTSGSTERSVANHVCINRKSP
jgi:hypothetical protein